MPPQTQSSLAISGNGKEWFIVNASPDLGQQIVSFPPLHPSPHLGKLRHSPIEGILLTNADLDHVLGLLLLREGDVLPVHATGAVRESLELGLHIDAVLGAYSGVTWHSPSFTEFIPLLNRNGEPGVLEYKAIALPGISPPFVRSQNIEGVHSLAYLIRDTIQGKVVLIAPDVAEIVPELKIAVQGADVVFWDGTFWSDDELRQIKPSARLAREIGHLPIQPEILETIRGSGSQKRIFIHINNTNPLFNPASPERRVVERAGWQVGYDGMELKW